MVGKLLFFLSAATATFLGLSAGAVTTSQNVDIIVTHGACANGPQLVTDKSTYAPGETIAVTANCGTGNPSDWLTLSAYPNENAIGAFGASAPYFTSFNSTAVPFVTNLSAPNIKADRDVQFQVVWLLNNTYVKAALSAPFTVTKAVDPPAPVATLPSALAADPFTPDHVITVCLTGGCNYTNLGDAVDAANTAAWDNVQIKISAGQYEYPVVRGIPPIAVHHLWIKGLSPDGGKTRAHLFGVGSGSQSILGVDFLFSATGAPSVTLDNLEIGPWNYWTIIPRDYRTWTMRNIYVHDTTEGLISSNAGEDYTLNFYNVVFARSGGSDGPEHDVYVGEGNGHVVINVANSVFDRALYGHSFKERAQVANFTCDMFIQNSDDVFNGSETVDIDSGSPTFTSVLSVNGAGSLKAWTDQQSFDNMRYGADWEVILDPNLPMVTGSTFISEQPNSGHWFFTLGIPLTSHRTFTNNKFVWPDAASKQPGSGGMNEVDSTGVLYSLHTGNTNDVTIDGSNGLFTSRASAGLSAIGSYPHDWRDFLPWMPAACTDPVGLVHIPAN